MGLPLNMTISQFTTKAAAKGISHDKKISAILNADTRAFKGRFFGADAAIYVYYNLKTKLVYRAKACVDFDSRYSAEKFLKSVLSGLEKKYPDGWSESDTQDGFPSFTYYMPDTSKGTYIIDNEPNYTIMGGVDGYITTFSDYPDDSYTVHIDYIDLENQTKNVNSNIDDL